MHENSIYFRYINIVIYRILLIFIYEYEFYLKLNDT